MHTCFLIKVQHQHDYTTHQKNQNHSTFFSIQGSKNGILHRCFTPVNLNLKSTGNQRLGKKDPTKSMVICVTTMDINQKSGDNSSTIITVEQTSLEDFTPQYPLPLYISLEIRSMSAAEHDFWSDLFHKANNKSYLSTVAETVPVEFISSSRSSFFCMFWSILLMDLLFLLSHLQSSYNELF